MDAANEPTPPEPIPAHKIRRQRGGSLICLSLWSAADGMYIEHRVTPESALLIAGALLREVAGAANTQP